jgi:hypothetical protein
MNITIEHLVVHVAAAEAEQEADVAIERAMTAAATPYCSPTAFIVNRKNKPLALEWQADANAMSNDPLFRVPRETPQQLTDAPQAIGQPWPGQGGIYAGLMRGEKGQPDYHLIVPTDPAGYNASVTWGERGVDVPLACSSFDGLANTTVLCEAESRHPAAEWAASLAIDGHDDFYLPSTRELRLCWVNVPELFETGWYWTSTQASPNSAWFQDFDVGGQNYYGKGAQARARAVRRFLTT